MIEGALKFLLIAVIALPLAGMPFAIWLLFQYRRDTSPKRMVSRMYQRWAP
jgi:hypothetical protein